MFEMQILMEGFEGACGWLHETRLTALWYRASCKEYFQSEQIYVYSIFGRGYLCLLRFSLALAIFLLLLP